MTLFIVELNEYSALAQQHKVTGKESVLQGL